MDLWIQTSSVICQKASVTSDTPQATSIGIDILKKGGNAADAAVAAMAAVSVISPKTCGIGGDCQCLFFRSRDKAILTVNGSGRTGKDASLKKLKNAGIDDITSEKYRNHGLWVSVPGTVAGMFEVVKYFGSGKLTMQEILAPAIKLAEEGTPIPYKQALVWKKYQNVFKNSKNAQDLLIEGKAPAPGDIMKAPKLAQCLKNISEDGPEAFYCGDTAQQIVRAVQEADGVLTLADLEDHLLHPPTTNPSEAARVDFKGFRIWEMNPNTIGVVALVAFNVLKDYDLKSRGLKGLGHNSPEYIHLLSEVIKHAYSESWQYVCDPEYCPGPLKDLLSEVTALKIRQKINPERGPSSLDMDVCGGGNTSYLAAVDADGNGCSFICSVASSFGSGILPDECGFVLHDRAKCMSMSEDSPNVYGSRKLPLSTIIPSLVTEPNTGALMAVYGVIGRWIQPQGHLQVLLNMIVFGMDPQVALNQPRFFVGNLIAYDEYKHSMQKLCLESGINENVLPYLTSKGYKCEFYSGDGREIFGRGHVIARAKLFGGSSDSKTWWSGADPRSDGCAMGI